MVIEGIPMNPADLTDVIPTAVPLGRRPAVRSSSGGTFRKWVVKGRWT